MIEGANQFLSRIFSRFVVVVVDRDERDFLHFRLEEIGDELLSLRSIAGSIAVDVSLGNPFQCRIDGAQPQQASNFSSFPT